MMAKEKQLYVYIFCSQKIHETFRFQQPMSKGTKRSKMSELFFTYNMYLLWLRSLALGLGFFSPSAHYCGCGSESIRFLVHNKTQWSAIINGCMIRLNNRIMFEAILSHLMFNGCLILVSHISKRVLFFFGLKDVVQRRPNWTTAFELRRKSKISKTCTRLRSVVSAHLDQMSLKFKLIQISRACL